MPRTLSVKEQVDFLTALKLGHSVTKACEISGVNRRRVYYFKAEDPEFDEAWKDAAASSLEELEDELRSRALDREDGKSHMLLMFLLKKLNPEYRDNYKVEVSKHTSKTHEFDFSTDEVAEAIEILKKAQDRATVRQPDKSE